jgi:tetratricopeptide (TPR) repeat protein
MSFFRQRQVLFFALPGIAALLLCTSCHRRKSPEEKKMRSDLRHALTQRSYHDAELLARQILKVSPNDNGTWDRLVQAQFGAGNLQGAKETLTAWRRSVRNPSAKLNEYTGDVALAENDSNAALQAWHRSLEREPNQFRVLTKVARVKQQQRQWSEADTAWTAALAVKEAPDALAQRAMARRHLHHWPEALADLSRARKLAPSDTQVIVAGRIFDRLNTFLPKIRDIDRGLAVSPNHTTLLTDRSLLFLRGEDFELALEDAEAASKLAPWLVRPKIFGNLALLQLGQIAEAEKRGARKSFRTEMLTPEFLETIRRLDSEISVERKNADLFATRAWHLNEIGQPALALQDAVTATQLDLKSPSACAEKGYALMKLGRANEAFEEVQRATMLDPNYGTAWQYRGELEMERGEYPAAIDSLSRALSLNQTATALQKREACYRKLGQLNKADEDRRALEELQAGHIR